MGLTEIMAKHCTAKEALARQVAEEGYCVLPSVLGGSAIARLRQVVLCNLSIMGQTRANPHSYHLAGFDRFQELSPVHFEILDNDKIKELLFVYYNNYKFSHIGLSDITVNRSQGWHTDLLRGEYSRYLNDCSPWGGWDFSCIKALLYLQGGRSLWLVPQSHLTPSPLDDEELAELAGSMKPIQLELNPGDVVMMDIRLLHRGSTDEEMLDPRLVGAPKILVSTVFAEAESAFGRTMQLGNLHRMSDWDRKHLG